MLRAREPSQRPATVSSLALPNIPRISSDEKSRQKYLSEYDKYEPELRRHHLGTPDTTNTIGLKDVPAEFDRTVPSLAGPTAAEREYERFRESHRAAARRKGNRASGGAGAAATAAYGGATASLKKITVPTALPPMPPTSPEQSYLLHENTMMGSRSSNTAAAAGAPERPAAAEEAASAACEEATAPSSAVARAAFQSTPEPSPCATSANPQLYATATTALKKQTRPISAPLFKATKPARAIPPRRGLSSATATRTNTPKPPSSRPRPASVTPRPISGSSPSMISTIPFRPSSALTERQAPTVESTARVLRAMLEPPPQYVASLRLNTSFSDLDWLRNGEPIPHRLTTIADYVNRDSAALSRRINSPRSTIVLLENGVSLEDWDPKAAEATVDMLPVPSELEQEATTVRAELREHRRAHILEQRDAVMRSLQDTYTMLCARVPLDGVVACYARLQQQDMLSGEAIGEDEQESLVTAVKQRQERQLRIFNANRVRMLRQVQQAQEIHERHGISEQRKQEAEMEGENERRRKALQEDQNRRLQQQRLEAHRQERERRGEAYRQQLRDRLVKAEQRNAERKVAREAQAQATKEYREAQEAERLRRMERNALILEQQAAELEQWRLEKSVKIDMLQCARKARMEEEHQALVEKHQRAAQLREEAKERAAEAEEAKRQAAVQRQLQVEERLREFHARRQEEAAQKVAREAAHHAHLTEVRSQASAKEELFRSTVEEKLSRNEQSHHEVRSRLLRDVVWRREAEWEVQEARAYTVLQKRRISEFNKLFTVVDLLEKHKIASALQRQRDAIREQAMRDREKLREERDDLKRKLEAAA